MKQLLLAIFLFAFTANIQAQAQKVDTVVSQKWTGSAWVDSSRTIYTYNANCQLINLLFQDWDATSSSWVNFIQINFTYVSGDYVNQAITQTWNKNNSTWKNVTRNTNTYDGSFKLLMVTSDQWLANSWSLFLQTTYTYDSNGYYDSVLTQIAFLGPLQNASLSVYDNNSDGTVDTVVNQIWLLNAWNNSSRISYTYNGDKTVSQSVTETWNIISSSWTNQNRMTYTYNGSGKRLTELTETWQTNQWVNSELSTNTYNGSGNLTTTLYQKWNTGTSAWDNTSRDNYSYTTSCTLPLKLLVFTASRNNNAVVLSWQTSEEVNTSHFAVQRSQDGINFSSLGSVSAKGSSANYYGFTDNVEKITGDKVYYRLQMIDKDGSFTYSKIVPVTLMSYAGVLKAYPNPVKDQLFILFNVQNATKAELRITDASGKTIYSQRLNAVQNNNAIAVNVASLNKGVYFVQVITENGVQRTRFMKQ